MPVEYVLLNPHNPMLFMGEEAAAESPFLFLWDWSGDLAERTREGRRKGSAQFSSFLTPELRTKFWFLDTDAGCAGHSRSRNRPRVNFS